MLSELGFSNGDHARKCVIRDWRTLCQDSWNKASRIWSGFSLLWGRMEGAGTARGEGRLGERCEQFIGAALFCVFNALHSSQWSPWGVKGGGATPECQVSTQPMLGLSELLTCTQGVSGWQPARGAAWSLGKRCRGESQEWEEGCCCREMSLCAAPSAFCLLVREISFLSPLQSIQQKNTAVLRESKSPLLSLAHIARPRMLKSAPYPKSDVSSVVLWMYWAKYMCTTSSCRTPPQRWLHFSGEITLECASHPNINPT